jgi:nucleoid-associated protein YgaU
MISANSRYSQSTVVPGMNLDGSDVMVILFTPPADVIVQYTYHQVTGSDRVDQLAARYYGDPTAWWKIANANPEIVNWLALPVGRLLRIPTVVSAR